MASFVPKLRIALCQLNVGVDKSLNISRASAALATAAWEKKSNLVVLPECWNCPYSTSVFAEYAEYVPKIGEIPDMTTSPSSAMLCSQAKELGLWLVGGSIPEKHIAEEGADPEIYNTSIIVNPDGGIVGKHRKVHLFDIDVPGKITFKESDALTAGQSITTVDTPWGVVGVGICYDMRFPEMATVMRQRGAKVMVYPGAFNLTTGPAHWELLQRSRAVDNQVFVATCSPARDESAGYKAWGHSTVVSPWGTLLVKAGTEEDIVTADVDFTELEETRQNIPCWDQKRHDLYQVTEL
mmetsp:Transcript_16984/g.28338  ORF Transcript_16984/g.28338 Transcript_16984/m.28338 type:complete len:296 (-) Transcript_16984:187-1074(-)